MVPVPFMMSGLPKDARGYPIPVIVIRDRSGKPIFAANDEQARQSMFRQDACHICGGRLYRGRWFVGGALSACAEHGQFMDGGLHGDCARYALKVCPYLAAPSYGRLVGARQLANSDRHGDVTVLEDETAGNARPEVFVAVMAVAQEPTYATVGGLAGTEFVRLVRPKPGAVRQVELWQQGERITEPEQLAIWRKRILKSVAEVGDVPRADVWRCL